MNKEIMNSCKCYGLYDEENIIGFLAIIHQPHPTNTKIKRVSRLVILPDYQGIGLGTKFLNAIANLYTNKGYDFSIITSAKNLISALRKSDKWCMYAYEKNKPESVSSSVKFGKRKLRSECYTGRFMYKK